MKGYNYWSYAPYKPLLEEVGDIYICRVVPSENSIHFEWLESFGEEFKVYYKKREAEDFLYAGSTKDKHYDILNLEENCEYEFYVESKGKKSRIRLARCGKSVGTVVNYLHPEDEAYSFSGSFLASPSLVKHPDGYLLASMDIFGHGTPQNITLIYRSDDNGKSWYYVSELMPCFWGKMFVLNGELYMLSCSTEYGDLLIGKSTDGGKTFGAPTVLLRGSNGKNGANGVHKNPQNVVIHKDRIYETLEWGSWDNKTFYHAAMVMSCNINDDLLVPENWSFSEPVKYNPEWEGTADGEAMGTLEGTLCVSPEGTLYNIMRYAITKAEPSYGLVLAYKVDTENPDAPLIYSHSIKMPCNNAKFMIKYDEVSKKYYSIVSRIDCKERAFRRNLLSLMSSSDLENWEVHTDLLDFRHEDMEKVGFQYADFEFSGNDIIYLLRTAMNGSKTYHDTNYSTFHVLKDFRNK